jgi:hypothetical protein
LEIEAPPEFAAIRARLESLAPQRLADISQFLALTDSGSVIRVVLAPESSDVARQTSPWIAGFAVAASDTIVIFPVRSPSYPHDTLNDVLRHEVAHILIERASAGRPIPRWFNEGLAMSVERNQRFEDQTQLLYQLVFGSRTSLHELDRLFGGNQSDQTRAYALSGAFVRDVLRRHGPGSPAEILMRIRRGAPFDVAFADVTGMTPASAEFDFWERQRVWTTWAPIITSPATLWLAVTILALFAIRRRRRRNAEIEQEWEKEEGSDPEL